MQNAFVTGLTSFSIHPDKLRFAGAEWIVAHI